VRIFYYTGFVSRHCDARNNPVSYRHCELRGTKQEAIRPIRHCEVRSNPAYHLFLDCFVPRNDGFHLSTERNYFLNQLIINKMKKILLTAAAFLTMSATTGATAQVTIGSLDNPQPFSILELVSGGTKGLRLPHMTASQRNKLSLTGNAAAQGLQIFNTTTECVETWNGTKWIAACGGDYVRMPDITGCKNSDGTAMVIPPVRFAKYNLGADSTLDTPKKQMKYLAEKNYSSNDERILDAHVYGGLYQWGRKNTLYAVNAETFTRYKDSDHSASMSGFTLSDNYDDSGQPKTNIGDYLYSDETNNYDWLVKDESSPLWNITLCMAPGRWGNGNPADYNGFSATDVGAVLYNGEYYQKPVKTVNDPCTAGFRVPTQDELERLGAYDCNPGSAVVVGSFETSITGVLSDETKGNGKGLTWIPVVCTYNAAEADRRCVPSTDWTVNTTSSGYAIYDTEEWTAATTSGGVYAAWFSNSPTTTSFNDKNGNDYKYPSLHSDAAPEPLLFLPTAGFRIINGGTVDYTGSSGLYWSSTVYGTYSNNLGFSSGGVSPSVINYRATGLSIRCVVE
jgi:hypothetical protein